MDGEAPCDQCQAPGRPSPPDSRLTPVPAAWVKQERLKQTVAQQGQSIRSQAAIEVDELERRLTQWTQRCPVCYIETVDAQISMHPIHQCPQADAGAVQDHIEQMTRAMRDGRKYAKFSCCFPCGVPQAICQRYESNGQGGWRVIPERQCQFANIIIPVVVSIMYCGPTECAEAVYEWMREDGVDSEHPDAVFTWFGQKIRWSGMECTRLIQVFYRLSEQIVAPMHRSHDDR